MATEACIILQLKVTAAMLKLLAVVLDHHRNFVWDLLYYHRKTQGTTEISDEIKLSVPTRQFHTPKQLFFSLLSCFISVCLVYEDSGVEELPLAPSSLAFFLHFRWINSSSTANLNCWHLEVKGYQVVSLVHMKTPDTYFHLTAGSFMKVHYIPLYVRPPPY